MALTLHVHYPAQGRRIVLRTDLDWKKDVPPTHVSRDGHNLEFQVGGDAPWFEFKAVLFEPDGTERWSLGSNYVGTAAMPATLEVYPMFIGAGRGRISESITVPGSNGCPAHHVRAYLPPGYDENPYKRYPVVYMHDGTNLFFPEESFQGDTWEVGKTLDVLDGMKAIRPAIVMGIEPVDREREYTARGWKEYGHFIVKSLMPAVATKGRTLSGPANTVVLGSSLGGLVSLYLAWEWPEVFGGAGCLSSTFGFDDELFARISDEQRRHIRIYLDSGYPQDNYESTQAMRDLLLRKGYRWGSDLLHFAHPGARHSEEDWALRLHLPLQFFFGRGPSYG